MISHLTFSEHLDLLSFNIQFSSYLCIQINLGIYTKDDKKEFSVLVDRPLGASSLVDGQVELMLHRYAMILLILDLP